MPPRKTTAQFIQEAKAKHGNKYGYGKTVYIGAHGKVIITCSEHGDFEQAAGDHLRGQACPKCGYKSCADQITKTTKQFIKDAKAMHGDRYDYSKVDYQGAFKKVIIICPEHGDFEQVANAHLQGRGCQYCANDQITKTTKQFINESKLKHGNKYDYSKVDYQGALKKVIITCSEHGDFEQKADSHLSGANCPYCAVAKQAKGRPARVYFIKLGRSCFKVGYTDRKIKHRFAGDWVKIRKVWVSEPMDAVEAFRKEQEIIKAHSKYKFTGKSPIKRLGTTEMFNRDVLGENKYPYFKQINIDDD